MVWSQMDISPLHTIYMIFGGYITLFSLCSLFVKEKLYIGEATVATVVGVIVGPHCLQWFNPLTWGNTDDITLELSRIVLIVQVFAVGVELPKKYMLRHWRSVFFLLVPVMSFGWVICGTIIWGLLPLLDYREGLCIAACITATDPVLASSVVGKGKFAKRVPGHLRNLLSAESGVNDGMAFPFIYLSLALIQYINNPGQLVIEFLVDTVLYECIFGCILGVCIGKCGRVLIKYCENHNLIDRESFLVFYFVLALFSCGVGVTLGTDDLLVSFSAGAAFSWDGWFSQKTEESHVSNVIDLLLNLAYFVYFGAIIPWDSYNAWEWGINPWRLVVIAILVVLFRRIPAMLICKPFIPDIRTWREALFCGHFGPIGVGALFVSILARGELETGTTTPLATIPPPGSTNYLIIAVIWPVVTFLVITSILVHGSSIAVFTLGKHINTMTFTLSYTREAPDGPTWLSRLPRLEIGQSVSIRKDSDQNGDSIKPPPPAKTRRKLRLRSNPSANATPNNEKENGRPAEDGGQSQATYEEQTNDGREVWQEGNEIITEDREGEVLRQRTLEEGDGPHREDVEEPNEKAERESRNEETETSKPHDERRRKGNVFAYQIDDTVVWENEEGEVIRRYTIPKAERRHAPTHERMKVWFRGKSTEEVTDSHKHDLEAQRTEAKSHVTEHVPMTNVVDPTERIIPAVGAAGSSQKRYDDRDQETAAERRRREAALGLRKNESDSEDESEGTGGNKLKPESRYVGSSSAASSSSTPSSSNETGNGKKSADDEELVPDPLRRTTISFVDAPSLERGDPSRDREAIRHRRHSPRPSLTWSEDVRK